MPLAGCAAASLVVSGATQALTAGPAGAPSMGSTTVTGTCSTTNATATRVASFTPGGDGGYSLFGHLVGLKDDETVYSVGVIATWKKTGGTLTAIGVQKFGEQTGSLDPGDPTATVSAGAANLNVVGIAATNINWSFYGALLTIDAF